MQSIAEMVQIGIEVAANILFIWPTKIYIGFPWYVKTILLIIVILISIAFLKFIWNNKDAYLKYKT